MLNNLNLILITKLLIISVIVLYGISAGMALFKRMKTGLNLSIIAWLVNLSIFILNWIMAGEPPFGSMYHVLITISLSFLPAYLLLKYRDSLEWLLLYFSFAPIIPLTGCLFMNTDMSWQRMAALQSLWFVPHVSSYVLSYSLDTVAFILSIIYFIRIHIFKHTYGVNNYEEAIYKILLTAFPLMTFGMLSGALWAEETWGSYWSWDVKESWALITWLLYLVYFHCRKTAELKKWAILAQTFAFLALLTTFLVVNFSLIPRLKSLLHAYI